MKVMTDAGIPLPDYITTSRWKCLVLDCDDAPDTSTIELIVNTFSAVTDLKFTTDNQKVFAVAERLLQHPQWTSQLSSLLVYHANTKSLPNELVRVLIAAINRLPALQHLAVKWHSDEPSELTILSQLKVIVFNCSHFNVPSFQNSLKHQAAENVTLQVHFISHSREEALLNLSESVRSRIVRWGIGSLDYDRDHIPLLCQQLPSLTTLSVRCIETPQLPRLFTALTQLQQLVYLKLNVDFGKCLLAENRQSMSQLNSVQTLYLGLYSSSHSQVQWLNLQWTLPNCQVIRLVNYNCLNCKTIFYNTDNIKSFISNKASTFNCLRRSFSGVPPERITLGSSEPYFTLAQVMSEMAF